MFSASNELLDSVPGTLMLNDCLEQCQANDSCSAVNYETGLCVLFSSNADKLPGKYNSISLYYSHNDLKILLRISQFTFVILQYE